MFPLSIHRVLPMMLALGVGTVLFAGCHGHGRHGGDPHKKADKIVDKMKNKLELNQDQEVKARKIAHEVADRAAEFRAMRKEVRQEALLQLRAAAVDEGALNQNLENQEAKFKELRTFMIQKFAEFHAVLTPEQREKLAAYLEKGGQKMRKHRD